MADPLALPAARFSARTHPENCWLKITPIDNSRTENSPTEMSGSACSPLSLSLSLFSPPRLVHRRYIRHEAEVRLNGGRFYRADSSLLRVVR